MATPITGIVAAQYLELEYEGWSGAIIKTNSSHRKGISFLHGDVTVTLKNLEELKLNQSAGLSVSLRLMAIPKGKRAPRKEVSFSVKGKISNPHTVALDDILSPISFNIDQIQKSRKQGFQPYARYNFFFSASLHCGKSVVCSLDGDNQFEMTTSPNKKKDKQNKHHHEEQEQEHKYEQKQERDQEKDKRNEKAAHYAISPPCDISFEFSWNEILKTDDKFLGFMSLVDVEVPMNELEKIKGQLTCCM